MWVAEGFREDFHFDELALTSYNEPPHFEEFFNALPRDTYRQTHVRVRQIREQFPRSAWFLDDARTYFVQKGMYVPKVDVIDEIARVSYSICSLEQHGLRIFSTSRGSKARRYNDNKLCVGS